MTAKFVLAFALCYWLFTNGKLDFSLVSKSFHMGYLWIMGLLLLALRNLLNTARFKVLFVSKTRVLIPFIKVLSFDAVGSFFSVILPGSAAGDVIRFFYYKDFNEKITKSTIATLLVLDRLIGLTGLLVVGVVVSLIQFEIIRNINPALLTLVYINIFLFIGLFSLLILFFTDVLPQDKWLTKMTSWFFRWPKIQSIAEEMLSVQIPIKDFWKALFLGIVSQAALITAFWTFSAPFLSESVSFLNMIAVIPIGLIGSAMPITPAGLGVGHLLFENLFKMVGVANGASLFNLTFLGSVSISLLGVIPYLLLKKPEKKVLDNPL